jgi:Domain of unknown function (DUF4371)
MLNQQNSKRFLPAEEVFNYKKNKILEQDSLLNEPSVEDFNFLNQTLETNEFSDNETIISDDNVEASQNTETNEKTHFRKTVNQQWFNIYTWLGAEEIDGNTMLFCKICRTRNGISIFAVGTKSLRHERIKNHLKTREHKESVLQLQSNQDELSRNIMEQMDKEKLQIISLMRTVYFSSKRNIPLNIFSDLCELISLQIENMTELIINDNVSTLKPASLEKLSTPKLKYGSRTNNKAAFDFLDSIVFIIKKSLFEELNSSTHWSIMIDETNSVDGDKYLAIVGKCITNNMPFMRYLGMVNLDSTDGENIFNQIILFCNSNGISYNNIFHFGSDGASNMIGMNQYK